MTSVHFQLSHALLPIHVLIRSSIVVCVSQAMYAAPLAAADRASFRSNRADLIHSRCRKSSPETVSSALVDCRLQQMLRQESTRHHSSPGACASSFFGRWRRPPRPTIETRCPSSAASEHRPPRETDRSSAWRSARSRSPCGAFRASSSTDGTRPSASSTSLQKGTLPGWHTMRQPRPSSTSCRVRGDVVAVLQDCKISR